MPDPTPMSDDEFRQLVRRTLGAPGRAMTDTYILDGTIPIQEPDLRTWARWFKTKDRQVAETWVTPHVRVSTIFLGLDHALGQEGPVLFETMVFGGPCDGDAARYRTWGQAEHGHQACVDRVQAALETRRRAGGGSAGGAGG